MNSSETSEPDDYKYTHEIGDILVDELGYYYRITKQYLDTRAISPYVGEVYRMKLLRFAKAKGHPWDPDRNQVFMTLSELIKWFSPVDRLTTLILFGEISND